MDDTTALVKYLYDQGHFHTKDDDGFVAEKRPWDDVVGMSATAPDVQTAIRSWQSFRPLEVDGNFGEVSAMMQIQEEGCRCGHPDVMERRSAVSEWGEGCRDVTTAFDLDGIRRTKEFSVAEAWAWGHPLLHKTCNIRLSVIESMSKAMIYATLGSMSRGTLAYAYLPQGGCGYRLSQKYNRAVTWSPGLAREVMFHEQLHSVGLGHGGIAVMQPYASGRLNESNVIDDWVRKQLLSRYGPAVEPPPDPPSEPPGTGHGRIYMSDGGEFDALAGAYKIGDGSLTLPNGDRYNVRPGAEVPP